jgi:hypothetical protein
MTNSKNGLMRQPPPSPPAPGAAILDERLMVSIRQKSFYLSHFKKLSNTNLSSSTIRSGSGIHYLKETYKSKQRKNKIVLALDFGSPAGMTW